jgi:hypothetical protein
MLIITFWEHTKNERNIFICVAKSTQPTRSVCERSWVCSKESPTDSFFHKEKPLGSLAQLGCLCTELQHRHLVFSVSSGMPALKRDRTR